MEVPKWLDLDNVPTQPLLSDHDKAAIQDLLDWTVANDEFQQHSLELLEYLRGIETCKACKNCENCTARSVGHVPVIDNTYRVSYRPCRRYNAFLENNRVRKLLGQASIPPAYSHMTFDSFDFTKVSGGQWLQRKTMQALQDDSKGIYYTGKAGVGKTHLAVSLLKEWIRHKQTGLFITLPALMRSLRDGIENKDLNDRINAICDVDMLILDDFGAEKVTDWTLEQLFIIVNERYINNKKTIVTSNLQMEEVESRLGEGGERICSRLMGMCEVVEIVGSDYRIHGGQHEN